MPRVLLLLVFLCCTVGTFAQDVRISEFLATNTTGVADDDGTRSGWIEIWNPSTVSKVSMLNWKLSNGTTEFILPGVEIMPDHYLLVWASGKNRRVVTAPLHTNFIIPPEGGDLTLKPPSNSTTLYPTSSYIAYPSQQPDVSYGRDGANPLQKGFYTKPSPENANNYSGSGVAGKVIISMPSQGFTGSLTVELTEAIPTPGAVIRYTTNGTAPVFSDDNIATNDSPIYTGPLTVPPVTNPPTTAASTVVRARIFTPGLLPGETETRGYLLLNANSSAFSSRIPIIVVSNFNGGTPPDTGDQNGFMWVFEPGSDGVARMTSAPTVATRVVMDRRGSSTLGNAKSNLNIEARKARDNEDQDISLLSMPASADWVFHAPFDFDRTLIHNPFAYALSNAVGRYAPRTRMAEVFLDTNGAAVTFNNNASGDYFGVYNIIEKIRRGDDRVDIENLREYDNTVPTPTGGTTIYNSQAPLLTSGEVTGGYIMKVDRKDPGDGGFSTLHEGPSAGTIGFAYVEPKEMEILSPQRDPQEQYIKNFMTAFDNSMYAANYTDPVNGYAKYLDVDAALDHHLLNVIPMNVDALRLSGYMHKDRGGKLVYGPIWDFDRSLFAANDGGRSDNPRTWRPASGDLGTDFFNYTWWNRLFNDLEFYQKYIDRFTNLRRGPFSNASVNALIDSLNASITTEAVARDLVRWNMAKRAYTSPITGQAYTGQTAEIQRMKDWLQQRQGFMEDQWVKPVTISRVSGNVATGTTVTLSAPAGTIYYTTDGTDPRPLGGAAPTAANVQVYTGTPIAIDSTTRIRARAYNPSHTALIGANNPPKISKWSGRTDARFSIDLPAAAGALIVSEINYHPADPTATELDANPVSTASDFEFIEVKNIGSATIDLGDAQFTEGISFTFTGENALSLAPGEHAIIAANPTAFAQRYGAKPNILGGFSGDLSNTGERLLIRAANGEQILDFSYDDAWYPTTDGTGPSLVVYDQAAAAEASADATNWRASAAGGGSPGSDDPPFARTLPPDAITATSVSLKAEVIANGTAALPEFVFQDVRYPVDNVTGFGPVAVEKVLTGLAPHATYQYRVEATNALGVRIGNDVSFTTQNSVPEAQDLQFHLAARAPVTLNVLDSAADADADPLTITAVTQGQLGTVSTNGTTVLYEPTATYTGNDTFTYTIADEFGGIRTATITLKNAPPLAVQDLIITNGDPVTLDLGANDTDLDADALSVSAVTPGARGTTTIGPGATVTYTPGVHYLGRDTFTYTITDGSASSTATVRVRNTMPLAIAEAVRGSTVTGQASGTIYASLGRPATGAYAGAVQIGGGRKEKAIFGPDGALRLQVGASAPALPGETISKLGEPSGYAVVANVKGSSLRGANDTVLYAGLDGDLRIAAREGDSFPGGTLKSFVSIDGTGTTVFFTAKLGGASASNDTGLFAAAPEGGFQLLAREGSFVGGEQIKVIGTLVPSAGTSAEGRWRVDAETIGVRLTFASKHQALYSIPATAASPADWTVWSRSGDAYTGLGNALEFGLPGFGPDSAVFATQLQLSGVTAVSKANDEVLLRSTAEGTDLLAREGSSAPDASGKPLSASFKTFSDPVAGAGKRAAFAATLAGFDVGGSNRSGLWWINEMGVIRLLARTGAVAPGGGVWSKFESLVLPDGPDGGPIFSAKLTGKALGVSGGNNRGLWGVDSSGTLLLLLRTGERYDVNGAERQLKSFLALVPSPGSLGSASSYDNDQHVTALATFVDGTQALLRIAVP